MVYRSLLGIVRRIGKDLEYRFAYWWVRIYCYIYHIVLTHPSLPSSPVEVMNLQFQNPVGLAAGFDRDGKLAVGLQAVGFGFVEIGTVNIDSENGSDDGLAKIARNSRKYNNHSTCRILRGVSLGSLSNGNDERAVNDFVKGMKSCWHFADYLVINLSRPGSVMRSGEDCEPELSNLLCRVKMGHTEICEEYGTRVPVVIKLAIRNETRRTLPASLMTAWSLGYDGLLVAFENWPSFDETVTTVGEISTLTNGLPIIVVGGIGTADNVLDLLNAGASLVQCYSLVVEHGPHEVKDVIREVVSLSK